MTKLYGSKVRRVLQELNDGEWHGGFWIWSLPNVAWGTINQMVAIGMIEERRVGRYREFRLSATTKDADLGDLWIE